MPGRVTNLRGGSDQPHDRLTRIANEVLAAVEQHPESRGEEQVIILIRVPVPGVSSLGHFAVGAAYAGIGDPQEALNFLLAAAEALAVSQGQPFQVIRAGSDS